VDTANTLTRTKKRARWSTLVGRFFAHELELIDEPRAVAHLLCVEVTIESGRDAVREQVKNEYAWHLRVLGADACFLFRSANLAHVLGILVQIGLVPQALGYPVDTA
jgi:hypothetical protein